MEQGREQRRLVWATAAFLLLHVYHMLIQGGGGWNRRYEGPRGAIWQYLVISARDPVLSAGLSDFAVLAVLFAVWGIDELPPTRRNSLRVKLWLAVYTMFPGLGALLYRLWLRPWALSAANG